MGAADAVVEQGGGGCPDLGPDILGGGSVGTIVLVRDMGDDTAHWEVVGGVLPQGGTQADRGSTLEREGRSVVIPPAVERNGGGGTAGGGDLRLRPP